MRYGKPNELFRINSVKFDFRNKYKYKEETDLLKQLLDILEEPLTSYLISQNVKLIPKYATYLKLKPVVHIALTDKIGKREKGHLFGKLAIDNNSKEIILVIHVQTMRQALKKQETPLNILLEALIHEILHLFYYDEETVRKEAKFITEKSFEVLDKY